MKIETLREFITIVKCGSYTKAAKELFLSQPSLSAHIAAMEKELGFSVLNRDSTKLSLTVAGTKFIEDAQLIVSAYEDAVTKGRASAKAQPPIRMQSFSQGSPLSMRLASLEDLDVVFIDTDFNTDLLTAITEDIVDVGLCPDFSGVPAAVARAQAANIAFEPVGRDFAAIAMSKANPLAGKESLTKADLEGKSTTIYSAVFFDEWKQNVTDMLGEDVHLQFRLKPVEGKTELAREDLGDSIHICGSTATAQYYEYRDDVVLFLEVDGKPLEYASVIAYRNDGAHEKMPAFIEALKSVLREMSEEQAPTHLR